MLQRDMRKEELEEGGGMWVQGKQGYKRRIGEGGQKSHPREAVGGQMWGGGVYREMKCGNSSSNSKQPHLWMYKPLLGCVVIDRSIDRHISVAY